MNKKEDRYEKVIIDGKSAKKRVHCGCTTGGNSRIAYLTIEQINSQKDCPTNYIMKPGYEKQCPECGYYYFYFIKGGPRENAKYLRK